MQNKKLIILVVLSIVVVFSLTHGILVVFRSRGKLSLEHKDIRQEYASSPQVVNSFQRTAKRSSYSSWARDPFLLAVAPKEPTLDGILWDKYNPMVVINGKILKKGDKIDVNTIIDIRQDKVILNNGIKNFELRLEQ